MTFQTYANPHLAVLLIATLNPTSANLIAVAFPIAEPLPFTITDLCLYFFKFKLNLML